MLEYMTTGPGARFGLIIHPTDAEREYAYDRTSRVGKLDKAWMRPRGAGEPVANMKDDWNTVFPTQK
jgi:hypothetical protein